MKCYYISFNNPFLPSIGIANASLQESDLLRLVKLTPSADMKWKIYIEFIARTTAKKLLHCVV